MDMSAGYSKNALIVKLGLKPGIGARFINEPPHYRELIGGFLTGVTIAQTTRGEFDFIHCFTTRGANLNVSFPRSKSLSPKQACCGSPGRRRHHSSRNDLGEAIVRKRGLEPGLVDVKVCAVDEDWSELKFVWRVKDC